MFEVGVGCGGEEFGDGDGVGDRIFGAAKDGNGVCDDAFAFAILDNGITNTMGSCIEERVRWKGSFELGDEVLSGGVLGVDMECPTYESGVDGFCVCRGRDPYVLPFEGCGEVGITFKFSKGVGTFYENAGYVMWAALFGASFAIKEVVKAVGGVGWELDDIVDGVEGCCGDMWVDSDGVMAEKDDLDEGFHGGGSGGGGCAWNFDSVFRNLAGLGGAFWHY